MTQPTENTGPMSFLIDTHRAIYKLHQNRAISLDPNRKIRQPRLCGTRISRYNRYFAHPRRFMAAPMSHRTDDLRIKWTKEVLPPVFLEEELPITEKAESTILQARKEIVDILAGKDHRLLVIVGPCSIH